MDEEDPSSPKDLHIHIPGLIRPEFIPDNRQIAEKVTSHTQYEYTKEDEDNPTIKVKDARAYQDITEEKAASLFNQKGFCLFPQITKVKQWNEDYIKGMICGSDITSIYAPELEGIIRNHLLAQYNIISVDCPPAILRRGPGSKNSFYGSGVHQDFGITLQDYKNNIDAYDRSGQGSKACQKKFDNKEVEGMMVINFWRPVGGYTRANPLLNKPLAVCDPKSVKNSDTVHTGLDAHLYGGIKGKTTDQMALKYNPVQQWFYYPAMNDNEVLVFKQFEIWKDDPKQREEMPIRGCFHTAIDKSDKTPPRQSTECRVTVYIGSKKEEDESTEQWTPPPPLYPKTGEEWCWLMLDLGSIGMIFAAVWSVCPAIPSYLSFIYSFAIVSMIVGLIKFHYSLRREDRLKRHSFANCIIQMLGLAQLALGIWGMALVFPNLEYLSNPSSDTCELGPILAMFIPSIIIALVIVGLIGFGVYSFIVSKRRR